MITSRTGSGVERSHRNLRQERSFGLVVGAVLALVGIAWIWRGKHPFLSPALLTIGLVLSSLALIAPRTLEEPARLWMKLGEGLSLISGTAILGLLFYLLITPLGFLRRLAGGDPLRRRSAPMDSYWVEYPARHRDPKHYEKMY